VMLENAVVIFYHKNETHWFQTGVPFLIEIFVSSHH